LHCFAANMCHVDFGVMSRHRMGLENRFGLRPCALDHAREPSGGER